MRNDHKGKRPHDICGYEVVTFYASGQRGDEVRGDGKGGILARGYYAMHECKGGALKRGHYATPEGVDLVGPYNTRSAATEAGIESLNHAINVEHKKLQKIA